MADLSVTHHHSHCGGCLLLAQHPPGTIRPTQSIQKLVMGAELLAQIRIADKHNDEEQRLVMVQAVFERI